MDQELRNEFLNQLRNPSVEQENGGLRTGEKYCATGLLVKIMMEKNLLPGWQWKRNPRSDEYRLWCYFHGGSNACIPSTILEIVGLTVIERTKIEEWNDGTNCQTPLTFPQIADKIEQTKIGLPDSKYKENFDGTTLQARL